MKIYITSCWCDKFFQDKIFNSKKLTCAGEHDIYIY